MRKNIFFAFLLLFLFSGIESYAQKSDGESKDLSLCKKVLEDFKVKNTNNQHVEFKQIEEAIDMASKNGDNKLVFDFKIESFEYYNRLDKNEQALSILLECIPLAKQIEGDENLALVYNNLGATYIKMTLLDKALDYFKKAHEINLTTQNKQGLRNTLNNIGAIYYYQDNEKEAYKYFEQSLDIERELGNSEGVALSLGNLAGMLLSDELYSPPRAKKYLAEAEQICIENNDSYTLATIYNNWGTLHENLKQYDLAIKRYSQALTINDSLGNIDSKILSLFNIANIYEEKGNYKKALEISQEAQELSDEYYSAENNRMLTEMETKYQSKEKETENELLKSKEKLNKIEISNQKNRLQVQRISMIIGAAVLLILIVFSIVLFRNIKEKKRINTTLIDQNEQIENQNNLLEEKQKEIIDSINYAKRIQSAILPPNQIVNSLLGESFVLYKPKDIVAGDFYWIETVNSSPSGLIPESQEKIDGATTGEITQHVREENLVLFAAADCTGHGVPGAMVSVVCNNSLNRSVREFGLSDPGEILDKTRELVVMEFEKSEEEVKDGMDIALCSLQMDSANGKENSITTLKYAGANNPIWIIRPSRNSKLDAEPLEKNEVAGEVSNEEFKLIEIKANKQPIGKFDHIVPFSTHELSLQKGDSLYIFSDGFADQFGGEKGKKFKSANFKKLLISIQKETMKRQRELLNEAFENWRGDLEQLDDVCIIGVRI